MKVHETPNGPKPCHATKRPCKYGEHFDSMAETEKAFGERNAYCSLNKMNKDFALKGKEELVKIITEEFKAQNEHGFQTISLSYSDLKKLQENTKLRNFVLELADKAGILEENNRYIDVISDKDTLIANMRNSVQEFFWEDIYGDKNPYGDDFTEEDNKKAENTITQILYESYDKALDNDHKLDANEYGYLLYEISVGDKIIVLGTQKFDESNQKPKANYKLKEQFKFWANGKDIA